jgi:hypothetical protein
LTFFNIPNLFHCFNQVGENPLRCTTHDEKGLVIIFWSPLKIMNQKLSKISKGLYFKLL